MLLLLTSGRLSPCARCLTSSRRARLGSSATVCCELAHWYSLRFRHAVSAAVARPGPASPPCLVRAWSDAESGLELDVTIAFVLRTLARRRVRLRADPRLSLEQAAHARRARRIQRECNSIILRCAGERGVLFDVALRCRRAMLLHLATRSSAVSSFASRCACLHSNPQSCCWIDRRSTRRARCAPRTRFSTSTPAAPRAWYGALCLLLFLVCGCSLRCACSVGGLFVGPQCRRLLHAHFPAAASTMNVLLKPCKLSAHTLCSSCSQPKAAIMSHVRFLGAAMYFTNFFKVRCA